MQKNVPTQPHPFSIILNSVINTDDKELVIATSFFVYPAYNISLNNTSDKYNILRHQEKNPFVTEDVYHRLLHAFGKAQKKYLWLHNFICRIVNKKKPSVNDCTLLGDPINASDMHVLICNTKKYTFSLTELYKIIESSLGSSDEWFICEPMWPQNPYTNIKFTSAELFHIYFKIRYIQMRVPVLLHLFFMHNFGSLETYELEHRTILRRYVLHQHVLSSHNSYLCDKIYTMLYKHYGTLATGEIDVDFPPCTLVKIFRPYLHLWYSSMYDCDGNVRVRSGEMLIAALYVFWKHNFAFGRKIIKYEKGKKKYDFICNYVPFNQLNTKNIFVSSCGDRFTLIDKNFE